MASQISPDRAADEGVGKLARGERIAGETQLVDAHDGKQRVSFVRPKQGDLPADMADGGPATAPVTTESVVETPGVASSWEAIEDDAADPATPDRRGRDPARTQGKTQR